MSETQEPDNLRYQPPVTAKLADPDDGMPEAAPPCGVGVLMSEVDSDLADRIRCGEFDDNEVGLMQEFCNAGHETLYRMVKRGEWKGL